LSSALPAVAILAARRTPIGTLNGGLSRLPAHELGAMAITASLADAALDPTDVDEVVLGQVLTAGQGMNPARQAGRRAGLPDVVPAALVNQVCGSGLRAVALGLQQIQTGAARIVVAGGQESMSLAPHAALIRPGRKLGNLELVDTVMRDGLSDAFHGYAMGVTAENVARRYQIDRQQQDAFALASQQAAATASAAGRFAGEIVAVEVPGRKGPTRIEADEHIRPETTLEALVKLAPAFAADGTVTAGNSSGINDGAAALVLAAADEVDRRGVVSLGRIAGWAHAGVDPEVMGLGPIPATRKLLARLGWQVADVDLWEVNEAFAAQSLAVIRDLGLDAARVNVNGGAIALGHPIGASGARILVTLVHEMQRRNVRRGVATLCIGGGMGIALAVERD